MGKSNIGVTWSKDKKILGAACVVGDKDVKVLLHSRRSFLNLESNFQA